MPSLAARTEPRGRVKGARTQPRCSTRMTALVTFVAVASAPEALSQGFLSRVARGVGQGLVPTAPSDGVSDEGAPQEGAPHERDCLVQHMDRALLALELDRWPTVVMSIENLRLGVDTQARDAIHAYLDRSEQDCGFWYDAGEGGDRKFGVPPNHSYRLNGFDDRLSRNMEVRTTSDRRVDVLAEVGFRRGGAERSVRRYEGGTVETRRVVAGEVIVSSRRFDPLVEVRGTVELTFMGLRERLSGARSLALEQSSADREGRVNRIESPFYCDTRLPHVAAYFERFGVANGALAAPGTLFLDAASGAGQSCVTMRWLDCLASPVLEEKLYINSALDRIEQIERTEYLRGLARPSLRQVIRVEYQHSGDLATWLGADVEREVVLDSTLGVTIAYDPSKASERRDRHRTALGIASKSYPYLGHRIVASYPNRAQEPAGDRLQVRANQSRPLPLGQIEEREFVLDTEALDSYTIAAVEVGCDVAGYRIESAPIRPGRPGRVVLTVGHFDGTAESYGARVFASPSASGPILVADLSVETQSAPQVAFVPDVYYVHRDELFEGASVDLKLIATQGTDLTEVRVRIGGRFLGADLFSLGATSTLPTDSRLTIDAVEVEASLSEEDRLCAGVVHKVLELVDSNGRAVASMTFLIDQGIVGVGDAVEYLDLGEAARPWPPEFGASETFLVAVDSNAAQSEQLELEAGRYDVRRASGAMPGVLDAVVMEARDPVGRALARRLVLLLPGESKHGE